MVPQGIIKLSIRNYRTEWLLVPLKQELLILQSLTTLTRNNLKIVLLGNSRLTFCEKYLSYLKEVQLGTSNNVKVDFHCGVKFTRVNQIEAMYSLPKSSRKCMKGRAWTKKGNRGQLFRLHLRRTLHNNLLYFIYARKIYMHSHVKKNPL